MLINKPLLAKIRNKLLAHPESYDQRQPGHVANTPCGARACIFGHGLLLDGFCTPQELHSRRRVNPETKEVECFTVFDAGMKVLGLKEQDAVVLFGAHASLWPRQFEKRFDEATTRTDRAQVAADYLAWIVKTGKVR